MIRSRLHIPVPVTMKNLSKSNGLINPLTLITSLSNARSLNASCASEMLGHGRSSSGWGRTDITKSTVTMSMIPNRVEESSAKGLTSFCEQIARVLSELTRCPSFR